MKISLAAAIGLLALTVTEAVKVNPLPAPRTINWATSGPVKVDNNFKIVGPKHDILSKAYVRHANLIKKERWVPQTWEKPIPEFPPFPQLSKRADGEDEPVEALGKKATLKTVNVVVEDLKADLQHGVDESYTLDITAAGKGTLKAKTVWGALNGLQTLNQIIISDGRDLVIEQPVHIEDAPKYPHRGVMYDTSRNFFPLPSLKRQIDALAYSKLNIFHWHITDTQSWPVEIKKHPQMIKDAYSPREVYTQKDIKELIRYGRERGVRVYPEVDMPGHSALGWAQVDPKAVTCADSWWDNDGWTHHSAVQPNPGQLDIAYPGTYPLIKDVYSELANVFTDDLFHVGFDELQRYCYNYSSYSMDWFKNNPGKGYSDFAQMYVDQALPIFRDRPGRRLVMWEDSVLSHDFAANSIPKDVIMQSWNNGVANIKALAKSGYDIIVSSADFFYLDCGHGGYVTNDPRYNVNEPPELPKAIQKAFDENPSAYSPTTVNYGGAGASWCAPYKSWQRIYNYDFTAGLTEAEAKHVIGGEAAMWSEQADETVIDSKVWPRAAALAENLWSGNRGADGYKRTTLLSARIQDFRERLVSRGVLAAPLVPKYCLKNPHHCDLFRNQTALGK
ncbi:MAG: putative beta-N-acetylhexosaminidase naga [Benniella sp.]|nr:MAG: putative beta-N-acetylhexosaminidase naga [Benniella sp.]